MEGYISNIFKSINVYEITSTIDDQIFKLPFSDLEIDPLIPGDKITFDLNSSNRIINLYKISNLYFDLLNDFYINNTSFFAYVYNKNKFGFEVSYNGYRCFCPYYEIVNPEWLEESEILFTYQKFNILKIDKENVLVSNKKILDNRIAKLKSKELTQIYPGNNFIGKVKRVTGYGIFLTNVYTDGLLHASSISNMYSNSLSYYEKNIIEKILKSIFEVGMEVSVTVLTIENKKYSLILNLDDVMNEAILNKISLLNL